MNENLSTFERLVLSLESAERQNILRQLADVSEQQAEAMRPLGQKKSIRDDAENTAQIKLADEPVFVRLWFRICAFFSSNSPERVYALHLVSELGRRLARVCPGYINTKKGLYTGSFCDELTKLKSTQVFFSSLLAAYETGKGEFYMVLGSLLIKDTCDSIAASSDPFSVPYDQAPGKDVRASLLQKLESATQSIPSDEKVRMYQSAQAIEWIRRFCDLPFDRMISHFGMFDGPLRTCPVDSISEEMKAVVGIFSCAKRIPVLLLEALFLFARQEEMQSGKFDIESECRQFVSSATGHLSAISGLKSTVPLLDFVRFSVKDVRWEPDVSEGGEDWFVFFKNAWKRRFELKWNEWNDLHRRAMLNRNICALLGVNEIHPLLFHPWKDMWLPLKLRREMSLTFFKEFFSVLYPKKLMKPLKILLLEGEFYRRENLAEYTDAFSVLDHLLQEIETFENRLSPKGDIGQDFAIALNEKIASIKGKARLDNLMLRTDSEVELILGRVLAAFASIDRILQGILDVVRGGPYETLVNMAAIQGKFNEQYRKDLGFVRQVLHDTVSIVFEAEAIEKESM